MTPLPASFGSCRVVAQIGAGAVAFVYHAVQEPIGRDVTVKALRPTIPPASPLAEQLAREAQLLGALRHDNVVALHDFRRTDDTMWLVLEHVDGPTLAELTAKAVRVPPEAAAAIAIGVARGLHHAHGRGIVHRNVRPETILVGRDGRVRVTDFGLAHDDAVPSSPEIVVPADSFGPPAYMAPEQILGDAVDARSDVFSVGVVLYELLAGARPFDVGPAASVAQRVRRDAPAPLRSHAPQLPRRLERVVLRCLEKSPDDRFATAADAAAALEEALREMTAAPHAQLIGAALVRARLADRLPPGADDVAPSSSIAPGPRALSTVWPAVRGLIVLGLLLGAGAAVVVLRSRDDEESSGAGRQGPLELVPATAGQIRVLAHPWAEVHVDGERIDVTPFARAIPLSAGKHYVTLRHPKAPDERRVVRVRPGETVTLDVTMAVESPPPAADAGAKGSPSPDGAPRTP